MCFAQKNAALIGECIIISGHMITCSLVLNKTFLNFVALLLLFVFSYEDVLDVCCVITSCGNTVPH